MNDAYQSSKWTWAMMIEIENYVQKLFQYDKKGDDNVVDTLGLKIMINKPDF